ncbi:hypothetical protein V7x_27610 [Crateriforma conspicua]|uniref:Uncharacterized protein n=1 Tax=Crateriforma conspicua TaxID=2527996 RepID=A0A5C6G0P3_9PLAN|nr:hypothetical protein V7x_27610 [Crateriforma conspicua]
MLVSLSDRSCRWGAIDEGVIIAMTKGTGGVPKRSRVDQNARHAGAAFWESGKPNFARRGYAAPCASGSAALV